MHITDSSIAPPGSWRFKHPDGFVSTGVTLGALVRKVAQYRVNRGEMVISEGFARLSEEVEAAVCEAMAPEDRIERCSDTLIGPKLIHWTEVKKFLLTMATWALKGFRSVPKEEALRRASICAGCPYNVGTSGCGVCRSALEGLRSSILKETTPLDDKLLACGVCGCDNRLQVHVPLEVLHQVKSNLEYPSHCWKRELVAAD